MDNIIDVSDTFVWTKGCNQGRAEADALVAEMRADPDLAFLALRNRLYPNGKDWTAENIGLVTRLSDYLIG